jgi:dolichol-phosphate mannosyltransferase
MGGFSNFAISFTIISILSGTLTLYGTGLNYGGPVMEAYGWPIVSVFVIIVGLGMAEIASKYPTAGGLYYWASRMGGPAWGWFTGWFNLIGQVAITAGIERARGDAIVTIDADLQDPPELLADMRATMAAEEADVVYAVRRKRDGESIFKLATAAAFYRVLDKVTDTPIPLDTGDFRLMSRRALDAFLSLPEQARFIRGMVAWVGFRQVPFPYDRQERHAGESKYPLSKMIRFALDAVTGFSTAPLRFASHAGLALTGASVLLALYIVVAWLMGRAIQGWTSLMLVVVLIGAVQMFVLGMIGEYLGRLYVESKRRPLYLVADIAGPVKGHARLGYRFEDSDEAREFAEAAPVEVPAAGPVKRTRTKA